MPQKFPRVLNKTEFGLTADVVCQPSIYTTVGTLTVPAQQLITFGVGQIGGGVDSREVCQIKIHDSSGELKGKVRILLADANELNTVMVAEQRTEKTGVSATDRTTGWLLGEFPAKAQRDSKLLIKFLPDSASAVTIHYDNANTLMSVPVTVYMGR